MIFEGKLLPINDMRKHANFSIGHLVVEVSYSLLSFSKLVVVVLLISPGRGTILNDVSHPFRDARALE